MLYCPCSCFLSFKNLGDTKVSFVVVVVVVVPKVRVSLLILLLLLLAAGPGVGEMKGGTML